MKHSPFDFSWWKAARAGEEVEMQLKDPAQGFYAVRMSKAERPQALAIWYQDGKILRGKLGDESVDGDKVRQLWPSAMKHHVAHQTYKAVMAGEPWPAETLVQLSDGSEDSTLIKNAADDDASLRDDIDEWTRRAKKAIDKGEPKTKEEADTISDIATKLRELCDAGDKKRLLETNPLRDQVADINEKWNSHVRPGQLAASNVLKLVDSYIRRERQKKADEARAAAIAAAAANEPPQPPQEPERIRVGQRKTVSQASRKYASITDIKLALQHVAEMNSVPSGFYDEVRRVALPLLKIGQPFPGVVLEETESAR